MIEELTRRAARYTIIVDPDINLQDADLVLWALSYRASRTQDITVVSTGRPPASLDPSAAPPGQYDQERMGIRGIGGEGARVIINATRKWAYPPVALPAKEYMEEALAIWTKHPDLPTPRLRQPWHGYTLGYWPDELQRYADMIVQGEYVKLGEEMEELQQPVRDDLVDLTPRVR
jgi:4-hydroxy-3-polyprenylbenzoate decarboxylase